MKLASASTAGLVVLALAGCQSTYYAAWEKVGHAKRDILTSRVESARDSQQEAKEEITDALAAFGKVVSYDGGDHGFELWATDGTPEGTDMVADIGPESSVDTWRFNIMPTRSGLLFFTANDGVHGMELWALPPPSGLWASFTLAPRGCQRRRGSDTTTMRCMAAR